MVAAPSQDRSSSWLRSCLGCICPSPGPPESEEDAGYDPIKSNGHQQQEQRSQLLTEDALPQDPALLLEEVRQNTLLRAETHQGFGVHGWKCQTEAADVSHAML